MRVTFPWFTFNSVLCIYTLRVNVPVPSIMCVTFPCFTFRTNDISLSQSDSSSKWMGELINDVFLGKTIHMKGSSISWLRDGEKDDMLAGEITKVLPPTPRYPQEPMFRVYFPEIDVAKTYTWKQLKASTPNLDLIGKSTTVAQHLE